MAGRAAKVEEAHVAISNGHSPAINALDSEDLATIIKLFQDTDIVELELKSKKFSLALRKKEALETAEPQVVYQQAPAQYAPPPAWGPPPPAPVAGAPAPAAAAPAVAAAPAAASSNGAAAGGVELLSPMAGTFYRSPAPGEPAFKQEGDKVKKGEKICIIEAMKLMNEIEADTTGTLIKFIAENGKGVFPNTPLALIKPE